MAFQEIKNVEIKGISACVPQHVEDNRNSKIIGSNEDIEKFIESTAILKRHTVSDSGLCSSDLCVKAAQDLIKELGWSLDEIDALVFVTQTPDYQLPATSSILQDRLGLSNECFSIQISLGCSGWVYGLSTLSALLSTGSMKKGLLLVGDTVTMTKSPLDKSTYPLFGDAGTATAIEYKEVADGIKFHTGTDGSGYKSIIIEDGGYRNPFSYDSLEVKERESGIFRNNLQSHLNGTDVFVFGITKAPKSIKALVEKYNISIESIDYLLLHQANKMMNDKIRKKVGVEESKVPYSLSEYGNTSSCSIPLTIVSQLREEVKEKNKKYLACGFGVGLSWGTAYFETENLCCPPISFL